MTTTVATLFIIIATLAGVAMVVVNALSESAWGMFTIVVTIPAALLTGLWMNKIRPGRVGEASLIGVSLVLLGVLFGKPFADSSLAPLPGLQQAAAVDHPADLCGDRLDPAGVGAAVPARLPELVHEDRRDRGAGGGDLGGPSDAEDAGHHALHRTAAGRSCRARSGRSCAS